MGLAEDLNSLTLKVLRGEVSKTNIKRYSHLKKAELIKLMVQNQEKFQHLLKKAEAKKEPVKKVEVGDIAKDIKYSRNGKSKFISYMKNNINIKMEIEEDGGLYLDQMEAQKYKDKPRAPKGMTRKVLCQIVRELLKKGMIKLSTKFSLQAGRLNTEDFDRKKLDAMYSGMGFKKTGEARGMTQFEQSVSSFLKWCDKK